MESCRSVEFVHVGRLRAEAPAPAGAWRKSRRIINRKPRSCAARAVYRGHAESVTPDGASTCASTHPSSWIINGLVARCFFAVAPARLELGRALSSGESCGRRSSLHGVRCGFRREERVRWRNVASLVVRSIFLRCIETGNTGKEIAAFMHQEEGVSPVAPSENEIERSRRRPDCPPARIGRTRNAPKCLSQSSFVFVATDTSAALPLSLSLSRDLAVLSLLLFPARSATRLARASFRSFCLSTNVRGIVRRSVRPFGTEGRLEADGKSARTNAKGARRLGNVRAPMAYGSEARDKQERS
jgi:hypothetical protein